MVESPWKELLYLDTTDLLKTKAFEKALEKPAITFGTAINGLLLTVFAPLIKYNIKKETEIEAYKESILSQVSKIPKEKFIEPPLNIIGPAIEASKFYIDCANLKSMFSKLIASSMNIDTVELTHPSFIDVIKQLSPFDAIVLNELSNSLTHPIISYRLDETVSTSFGIIGFTIIKNLVKIDCINSTNFSSLPKSIDNLIRLGLIDVSYDSELSPFALYKSVTEHFYNLVNPIVEKDFLTKDEFKDRTLKVIHGALDFTNYGQDFINTCIS
jgi:hypothetical protein